MGMSGYETGFGEADTMQKQRASQWNDLFNSIASVGSAAVGAIPGSTGGWADNASNIFGAA